MDKFLFLGGDLRMLYAAEYLNKEHECLVYGFDKAAEPPAPTVGEFSPCDYGVLPLPVTADGLHINMPYCKGENPEFEILKNAVKKGGTVFTSKVCPALEKVCEENNFKLLNYFQREELQLLNAVPTAEGALEIMLQELPVTVWGSRVLITGFGRIGQVMARMLSALGAEVTVAARKFSSQAKALTMGCKAVSTEEMVKILPQMQVIVNTVPAIIFDKKCLRCLSKDCLLIDLASKSALEDMEAAADAGAKVIWALSLPGRTAPITAGQIIGKTIENMLKLEEGDNGR